MNANKTKATEKKFPPQQDAAGWDPYEIWRTRVLMPRLRMAGELAAAPSKATPAPASDLAA